MGFLVFIGFLLFRQVAPWTPQITVYSPRTHIYIYYIYIIITWNTMYGRSTIAAEII